MIEAIANRKSVRHYTAKPIAIENVYEILDAARSAPSAGNIQDRLFIVVTKEELKAEVAKACDQPFVKTAPVLVVVIADMDLIGERYGQRGKELYAFCDASAAIENMLIQATGMGIASCWVGAFHEPDLRAALAIPERFKPIAVVTFGYERESFERPVEKFDVSALAFKEKFGKHQKAEWEGLAKEVEDLKSAASLLDQRIKEKGFLNVFKEEFGYSLE